MKILEDKNICYKKKKDIESDRVGEYYPDYVQF